MEMDDGDEDPGPSLSAFADAAAPSGARAASWDSPVGGGVGEELFYCFEDSEAEQEPVYVKLDDSAEPSPSGSDGAVRKKGLLPQPSSWRAPARPLTNIESRLAASRAKLQAQLL